MNDRALRDITVSLGGPGNGFPRQDGFDIATDSKVRNQIKKLQEDGYGHYPVCVAKTQYSFSTDPQLRGAPSGHIVTIREVRLAAGAEFIVMVCGDIMTMPGLPKVPSADAIDVDDSGKIIGLF
jgi:formate--tetrahydrofolate ligase